MMTRILSYRPIQLILTTLIILGALICVFTPNYLLFKIGASFANQIMMAYLGLGLLFLILKQHKLTFTCFACCGCLCIFLKFYSNWEWPVPVDPGETMEVALDVAHFNVATSNDDYETTINSILASDADIISLQEVTPDWHDFLQESLLAHYPYSTSFVSMDPYGLAIYSKRKIIDVDTFFFEKIPNLHIKVNARVKGQPISIISSYTMPPLYQSALVKLKEHMKTIAAYTKDIEQPVITVGDYNAPPWFEEVRLLMQNAQLEDSRSMGNQGLDNLFQYPIDYILYSGQLHCSDFQILTSPNTSHFGIKGAYKFNTGFVKDAQKTIQ